MTRYLGGLITKDESLVLPANNFEDTSAPGVWTLEEAQALNKQGLWPTAGVSNPVKFVENIFSTHVWNGTGSDQSIANGIDLQNNDGLVWIKNRNNDNAHILFDSKRGSNPFEKRLNSNNTDGEHFDSGGHYIVPNSDGNGFTTKGNDAAINSDSSYSYVSWTWRAAPKFFDVVTYTGTGSSSQQVSHNLGQNPGMVICKRTDNTGDWGVWHRGTGSVDYTGLKLNGTNASGQVNPGLEGEFTSTYFKPIYVYDPSNTATMNINGATYVAYLFGHDTSSDGMIQCGSYTGDGGSSNSVNLGFEPQWIMIKASTNTSSTDNWVILDNIRGIVSNGDDERLYANTAGQGVNAGGITLTPNGFYLESNNEYNSSGATYIYMAIRRGPMQTPTSRSSVFAINNRNSTGSSIDITSNFPVDFFFTKTRANNPSYGFQQLSRLQGNAVRLGFYGTFAEQSDPNFEFDHNNKVVAGSDSSIGINRSGDNNIDYMFRRAPNFFDIVTYVGTGSAKTENHNLNVAPEMMWVKNRSDSEDWAVYYGDATDYLKLNTDAATADDNTYWNDTAPTSTVFTIGSDDDVNKNNSNYIAYLFATLAGISKVGTFSHTNGSSTDVDCGFSSGSSFVIAKRTDSTGDWYVWDSTRGIVSGNDPYVLLNSSAAEVTNQDYIDPLNSGFQIASGFTTGSYMFYAIAA
jgi:hypothetical protein